MSHFIKTLNVMRRGPLLPQPYRVAARHKPTFFAKLAMERWVALSRSVPVELKVLAQLRASTLAGCVW